MQVESLCPLRVSSMVWQTGADTWAFTVICKATYELRPGEARLAGEQEYPNDDENHWDDDPARSVYSPSDLVPLKPRADVVLVGHAFAPRGEGVQSLVARLVIGTIDKSIEARAEGAPFAKMPLRYERAGADPEANPVGVVGAAPNLARLGAAGAAVGFGPIAAEWPARAAKLGRDGAAWVASPWRAAAMPADLDVAFFNAAPADQQLDRIEVDERIALDNLNPIHPRLVTSLPGMRPRAFVARGHAGIEEIAIRADTLWIDTDRSICTVTWRGRVPMSAPDEEGRVAVLMEEPGAPLAWDDIEAELEAANDDGENPRDGATQTIRAVDRSRSHQDVLPFRAGSGPLISTTKHHAPSSPEELMSHTVTELPDDVRIDASPAWLPRGMRSDPPPRMPSPIPPPPVSGAWTSARSVTRQSAREDDAAWADSPEPAPLIAPPMSNGPSGVLGASNAAAAAKPWGNDERAEGRSANVAAPPARALPSDLVEILWFDPAAVPKIREAEAFREPIATMQPKRPPVVYDDEPIPEEPEEAKVRRDLFTALTVVAPLETAQIDDALEGALGERGELVPPLALVAGELALPFDEVETLKATIAAAAPLAAGDKKLREVVDVAIELVKGPLSPGAAEGVMARIKEAFAQPGRMLPPTYLETHTERLLLEERRYQRRTLFGARYLRALLSPAGGASPIPTYLPEALATTLPLYLRFRARLVVEVHLAQDQYETHPLALRAVVLARVAGLHRARK